MKKFKKLTSAILAVLLLFSALPLNTYAENKVNPASSHNDKNIVSNIYVDEINKQLYINNEKISEEQFIKMITETGIIVSSPELKSNTIRYSNVADLAPYFGWTIFVPGLGEIVLAATGIYIGGKLLYEVGSWAWNKVVDFINNDRNLTAERYIGKHCKGSILREFPSEYLGKTIREIERDAKKGNAKARKALKLLKDKRFRK